MFGRRKRDERPDDERPDQDLDDRADDLDDGLDHDAGLPDAGVAAATIGPWDSAAAPADDVMRVDLGALRVPMREGLELRVDMNEQRPIAATLVDPDGTLQLLAFAAPRSLGLWDDVRAELAESVRTSGGTTSEASGPYGTELHAEVVTELERGKPSRQKLRFIGIDGPRWLLRATISGAAVTDDAKAAGLLELLGLVVVHRGDEAMAPRDLLPLQLPSDATPSAVEPPPSFDPFERGPEITERR